LYRASLSSASLSSANLSSANLSRANLSSANLSSANLSRAEGINKHWTTVLYGMLDQVGKIRAYKLVNEKMEGPFNGGIVYEEGKTVKEKADTNENDHCSYGISLATLPWCMSEWQQGFRILVAEFNRKDIAAIPIGSDGKFRVHRCRIVGEKDLKELGLINE